jgi:DNA-directed RNA polymerase specialized sigma24 family protein
MLAHLRVLRVEKLKADARYIGQLLACAEAGYTLAEMARVLGLRRQSVMSLIKRRSKH